MGNPSSEGGLLNLYSMPPVTYFTRRGGVVMEAGTEPERTFKMRSELYQKQFFELILKL